MESMNQKEPTQLLLICLKEPRPKEVKGLSQVPQYEVVRGFRSHSVLSQILLSHCTWRGIRALLFYDKFFENHLGLSVPSPGETVGSKIGLVPALLGDRPAPRAS